MFIFSISPYYFRPLSSSSFRHFHAALLISPTIAMICRRCDDAADDCFSSVLILFAFFAIISPAATPRDYVLISLML